MSLGPIAVLLLLFWLVMPCLLGPNTAALLGLRASRTRSFSSPPAAVTLSRLYRGRRLTSTLEDRHAL